MLELISFIALAFVLGFKHSYDSDHLIAVSNILRKVDSIKSEPFQFLEHYEGEDVYKLRVGDYRALIDVDSSNKILKIQVVGHRKKVYKRFNRK